MTSTLDKRYVYIETWKQLENSQGRIDIRRDKLQQVANNYFPINRGVTYFALNSANVTLLLYIKGPVLYNNVLYINGNILQYFGRVI